MERLNYHHLLYFWVTAREGSVARACAELHLAQPTISGQIRLLEQSLGEKLFARAGRGLRLTELGRVVYGYADEIFGLGRELMDTLAGRPAGRPVQLVVGIADVIPKLVAYRLLQGLLGLREPIHVVCREDRPEVLLAQLAVHELDLVLSDAPVGPGVKVRAFSHLLGDCGVSFCATTRLARAHGGRFPRSLDGAPLLLPTEASSLRRSLDDWFRAQGVRPTVVAEFDDSALLNVFGQAGLGLFPVPSIVEREVTAQRGVRVVGRVRAVRERFYAISAERRIKHPALAALSPLPRWTGRRRAC